MLESHKYNFVNAGYIIDALKGVSEERLGTILDKGGDLCDAYSRLILAAGELKAVDAKPFLCLLCNTLVESVERRNGSGCNDDGDDDEDKNDEHVLLFKASELGKLAYGITLLGKEGILPSELGRDVMACLLNRSNIELLRREGGYMDCIHYLLALVEYGLVDDDVFMGVSANYCKILWIDAVKKITNSDKNNKKDRCYKILNRIKHVGDSKGIFFDAVDDHKGYNRKVVGIIANKNAKWLDNKDIVFEESESTVKIDDTGEQQNHSFWYQIASRIKNELISGLKVERNIEPEQLETVKQEWGRELREGLKRERGTEKEVTGVLVQVIDDIKEDSFNEEEKLATVDQKVDDIEETIVTQDDGVLMLEEEVIITEKDDDDVVVINASSEQHETAFPPPVEQIPEETPSPIKNQPKQKTTFRPDRTADGFEGFSQFMEERRKFAPSMKTGVVPGDSLSVMIEGKIGSRKKVEEKVVADNTEDEDHHDEPSDVHSWLNRHHKSTSSSVETNEDWWIEVPPPSAAAAPASSSEDFWSSVAAEFDSAVVVEKKKKHLAWINLGLSGEGKMAKRISRPLVARKTSSSASLFPQRETAGEEKRLPSWINLYKSK